MFKLTDYFCKKILLKMNKEFSERHIGIKKSDEALILKKIGAATIDELIEQTVPDSIRLKEPLKIADGISEHEYISHIRKIANKNKVFKSFIGLGYYNTFTPNVILRNIFENSGWYTAYTPYQAEISQGRLEALLNFQTMVCEMTGMEIANASLLDEGTAAAEAMMMFYNTRSKEAIKNNANIFLVSNSLFPQTIDILKTRAEPIGIEIIIDDFSNFKFNKNIFGTVVQYPDKNGNIFNYKNLVENAKANDCKVAVAADLLSLAWLTPPGEWGADIVFGTTQRFGIPMGFGGPHAAYFATHEEYKRNIPGRIIGVSIDNKGNRALRMALQTREQHIKREKATSNICTAQALLAIMAGFYAAYHGKNGIKNIASKIHSYAATLSEALINIGVEQTNKYFFDTLEIKFKSSTEINQLQKNALKEKINFRYTDKTVGISIDETTSMEDLNSILKIFAETAGVSYNPILSISDKACIPDELRRKTDFLKQPVFNTYHSETEMMRYMKKLENKDLALNRTMIPLGSCTMKLNAATEMIPLSWTEFANIHPFAPKDQTEGYLYVINELEKFLCEITGFDAFSFQPNSGAAGEYAGLMVIRKYHLNNGNHNRKVVLIPTSAHGTNPASTAIAGGELVSIKCDKQGNIDITDLKEKATAHKDRLSALMLTYPSTHGVFEENILEITETIHQCGGLVYMDGANMNAQVGLTNPAIIGADVCHLNLHKTFAIPHGGGGPGVGPIGVKKFLAPFLPTHSLLKTVGDKGITAVASAPFGSALVLLISYSYIKMSGGKGLADSSRYAILNANYIKSCLEDYYPILYKGSKNRVAHEMILDCNKLSKESGILAIDIAKRLMDYGFHAPTVAFPVAGTLMVEPTESEPLAEMDRFIEAMISIKNEIDEIAQGKEDKTNNVLKNAPHTAAMVTDDQWNYPYSRKKAAYPVDNLKDEKYWTPITRIDDAYGDRNLFCTCDVDK